MKAKYKLENGLKADKISVSFYITKNHIERAVSWLLNNDRKITKKSIEDEVKNLVYSLGDVADDSEYWYDYNITVQIAKKIYPEFY